MKPGDLVIIFDYENPILCLVLRIRKQDDFVDVFQNNPPGEETYRLGWFMDSGEVLR